MRGGLLVIKKIYNTSVVKINKTRLQGGWSRGGNFMSEQILEQLFESPVKVKLLKLFLRNPERDFLLSEIPTKVQADSRVVKRQLRSLELVGLVRQKKIKGNKKNRIQKGLYFSVNPNFDFYSELQSLVLKSSPTSKEKTLQKILALGRIRLALIAGIFLNNENSRVDLLLVGDNIDEKKLTKFLEETEAEVGKEIEYAAMDTREFEYRFRMFDRFIRDILEKPHEKMINKLRYLE